MSCIASILLWDLFSPFTSCPVRSETWELFPRTETIGSIVPERANHPISWVSSPYLQNAHSCREEVPHDEGPLFAMSSKNFPQVSPIDRALQLHFSTLEKTRIDHNPLVNNLILTFPQVSPFYRHLEQIFQDLDIHTRSSRVWWSWRRHERRRSCGQIHHRSWFGCDTSFSWFMLSSFRHRCDAGSRAKMADIKQGQQMIPFITCEIPLWSRCLASWFLVSMYLIWIFWVQINSIKQPIKRNSVVSEHMSHRRTSTFNHHFDHGFIVVKDVHLDKNVCSWVRNPHQTTDTTLCLLLSAGVLGLGIGPRTSLIGAIMVGLDSVVVWT